MILRFNVEYFTIYYKSKNIISDVKKSHNLLAFIKQTSSIEYFLTMYRLKYYCDSIAHPSANADAKNPDAEIFQNEHFVAHVELIVRRTIRDQNDDVWNVRSVAIRRLKHVRPSQSQCCRHTCAAAPVPEISDGSSE